MLGSCNNPAITVPFSSVRAGVGSGVSGVSDGSRLNDGDTVGRSVGLKVGPGVVVGPSVGSKLVDGWGVVVGCGVVVGGSVGGTNTVGAAEGEVVVVGLSVGGKDRVGLIDGTNLKEGSLESDGCCESVGRILGYTETDGPGDIVGRSDGWLDSLGLGVMVGDGVSSWHPDTTSPTQSCLHSSASPKPQQPTNSLLQSVEGRKQKFRVRICFWR